MQYSVVIPLYNEEESIALLHKKVSEVMESIDKNYEIIYVDDGSRDKTLFLLKAIKQKFPKVKIISFKENCGQSAAFLAGFKAALGTWIITLDGDLQNPPEEIATLVREKEGYDFITGIRKHRHDSFTRKISSKIARVSRTLVLKDVTTDTGCSLRMFKKEIVPYLPVFKNFHRFFTFLVQSLGFKVKEVEVSHSHRIFGKSKYGTITRAREGVADLRGVSWLKKRLIKYEIKYKS
jgi:dolichol-phosphate mannosyltransferase